MAAFIPAVGAMESGILCAINGGTLNDAKTVTLSRRQKSEYDTFGTWGRVEDEED